ncbi:MAG TPA: glycosyltransferase [Luteolibacter sp.]|nr:glycosyltransferase [Luteolibacter sp.]
MKIAMFTNTYLPHVGGVAKSVKTLEDEYRRRGHEVRVIAPEFDDSEDSPEVLRVPAIQNFNGSDFSVKLPFPVFVRQYIDDFEPDLIHSHHPFLLGDSALRESWKLEIPIVFTHHTLYEDYTHYVPLDSPALKRAAVQLATEYCNLCDQVIAPSESIAKLLKRRGVTTPIEAIPTGIDAAGFASGDGARFRKQADIAPDARVIGHVGRLAKEKNLPYLSKAVGARLREDPQAVFLVVGTGSAHDEMLEILRQSADERQIRAVGSKAGDDLFDAYAAMDWFVFASQTETQGLVLAEAMAAGKPVVALDGPGVREIVENEENGLLLDGGADVAGFSQALRRIMEDRDFSRRCADGARATAADFSRERCAGRMLDCYERLIADHPRDPDADLMPWDRLLLGLEIEWDLFSAKMSAASAAMAETPTSNERLD